MDNKKGFSIVELLAVIAILGIVLLIGYTSYGSISKKIKDKQYEQQISEIYIAAEKYSSKTGSKRMFVKDLISSGYISSDDGDIIKNVYGETLNCYYVDVTTNIGDTGNTEIETGAPSKGRTWKNTEDSVCNDSNITDGVFELVIYDEYGAPYTYESSTWKNYKEIYVGVKFNTAKIMTSNPVLFDDYKNIFEYDEGTKTWTGNIKEGNISKSLIIGNMPGVEGKYTTHLSIQDPSIVYWKKYTKVEGQLEFIFELTDNKNLQFYDSIKINNDLTKPSCTIVDECKNQYAICHDNYSGDLKINYSNLSFSYSDSNFSYKENSLTEVEVKDKAGNPATVVFDVANAGSRAEFKFPTGLNISYHSTNDYYSDNGTIYKLLKNPTYGELPSISKNNRSGSWYIEGTNTKITSNSSVSLSDCGTVVLEPKWKSTLSYNLNSGTGNCTSIEGESGQKWIDVAGSFCNPTRTGYIFDGWYYELNGLTYKLDNTTTVDSTGDIEVTANWTKQNEVTFTSYKKSKDLNIYLLLDASFSTWDYRAQIESSVEDLKTSLYNNLNIEEINVIEISNDITMKYITGIKEYSATEPYEFKSPRFLSLFQTDIKKGFDMAYADIKNKNKTNNVIIMLSDGHPFLSSGLTISNISSYIKDNKPTDTKIFSAYFDTTSDLKDDSKYKNFMKNIATNSNYFVQVKSNMTDLGERFVSFIDYMQTMDVKETIDLKYTYTINTDNLDFGMSPNVSVESNQRTQNCNITRTNNKSNICSYNSSNKKLTIDLSMFANDDNVSVTYWTRSS